MASAAPAPDYLVLGHLSLDQNPSGPALGGTAAYAALTARALGLRAAMVTSAADDLDLTPLNGVPTRRVPADRSTTFLNEYADGARHQHLLGRATPLEAAAVPPEWRAATIVHLAPIAGEISPGLTSLFPSSDVVGLTPQGWMRAWDDDGRVFYNPWRPAVEAVGRFDVVIIGVEDVAGDEAEIERLAHLCRLLVATEGPLGARVYWNGDVRRFPSPLAEPIDPTGAGDIFAASFFVRYQQTRDPWEATRFANVLASTSVTRRGLAGVPTTEEAERAAMVWTR